MIKVVHIDAGQEWRGGQKQVFLLHKGLLEKGIESFLVCNHHGELYQQAHEHVANCMGWNYSGKRSFGTKKDLETILQHIQPDIIHFHDSLSLNYSKVGVGIKIETRRVSYPVKWISRITKYKGIQHHVGVSQTITNYLLRFFKSCSTIHSSIDLAYYTNSTNQTVLKNKSEYNILFVGAYSKQKGIDVLIEAFAELIQSGAEATLHLCGSGELQTQLDTQIAKNEISNYVVQYGHQKDIAPFYQEADVVIVPSVDGEGSSGTIKEGIASLKPVIASDIEPNKELIDHGKTGFLFKSGNRQKLMKLLAKKPSIPIAGLEEKRLEVSCEIMVNKYEQLYHQLINSSKN